MKRAQKLLKEYQDGVGEGRKAWGHEDQYGVWKAKQCESALSLGLGFGDVTTLIPSDPPAQWLTRLYTLVSLHRFTTSERDRSATAKVSQPLTRKKMLANRHGRTGPAPVPPLGLCPHELGHRRRHAHAEPVPQVGHLLAVGESVPQRLAPCFACFELSQRLTLSRILPGSRRQLFERQQVDQHVNRRDCV